jgi:protein-disulfide isomerase
VVQLTCLFHFLVTLVSFLKARHENTSARSTSFFRVALITAAAGVLPLSSGLVASAAIASSVDKKALSSSELTGKFPGQTKNGDWYKGAITAKVELVEFTDFECPYCQVLHEKLKEVQESIGKGNLRIVFRNWPLSYHKYAQRLVEASRCSGRQGKFWDYTDWAFEKGRSHARNESEKARLFANEGLAKKAEELSLNRKEFEDCLSKSTEVDKITADARDAEKLGGKGTPFILINGNAYSGNWLQGDSLEQHIREIIRHDK